VYRGGSDRRVGTAGNPPREEEEGEEEPRHFDTLREATMTAEREKALALLGNKCARCGFDNQLALQIARIDGTSRNNWNNRSYYRQVLRDLPYYHILCANCALITRMEREAEVER